MGGNLRRWKVKDSIFSAWRELPGSHTDTEIFQMKRRGDFIVAIPIPHDPGVSDEDEER
jgi:hypothetical protein